jgi:hypothetical protein
MTNLTINQAKAVLQFTCGVEPIVATALLAPYTRSTRLRRAFLAGYLQSYVGDYQGFGHLTPTIIPSTEPAFAYGREQGMLQAAQLAAAELY